MNVLAERYVKLVLSMGQHDADYVDAYYGPAAWRAEAEATRRSLADIDREAAEVLVPLTAQAPRSRRSRDLGVVGKVTRATVHALATMSAFSCS